MTGQSMQSGPPLLLLLQPPPSCLGPANVRTGHVACLRDRRRKSSIREGHNTLSFARLRLPFTLSLLLSPPLPHTYTHTQIHTLGRHSSPQSHHNHDIIPNSAPDNACLNVSADSEELAGCCRCRRVLTSCQASHRRGGVSLCPVLPVLSSSRASDLAALEPLI